MIRKSLPIHLLLAGLLQAACSPPWPAPPPAPRLATAIPDTTSVLPDSTFDDRTAVQAARWHLLRAEEALACSLFEVAQEDLDRALGILTGIETGDGDQNVAEAELDFLGEAVERTYLALLPNLRHLSPDSPLTLLLEGVSEEVIEDLPPDAAPFVRIHQLSGQCDVPIDANPKVAASIHFFQSRGKKTFAAWLKRSGRYRALILDALRAEGLPEDLFYIAMIESGFNPRARSRAHAVGLWQFMESTGRLEGLHRTHWVDERRDPGKSTRAAARHLKDLHRQFRDWRLAIAAYNAGRGRVSRAVERAGTRDFWSLNLPRETRNYVPLFMAAAIISKDPGLFGFPRIEEDSPMSFEGVELPGPIMLETAARCMRTSVATLRHLNPELRRAITPPHFENAYNLKVPAGKGQSFLQCYSGLPESEKQLAWFDYRVKPRDNISIIGRKFGVSPRLIIAANNLRNPNRIYPGQLLHIPASGAHRRVRAPASGGRTIYTVKPGDTLNRIASDHGVGVGLLKSWNTLGSEVIHPGDQLIVRKPPQAHPGGSPVPLPSNDGKIHTVQPGETLWRISRRFAVGVEDLKLRNNLKGTLIHPGQKLVIPPRDLLGKILYVVAKGDTLYSIARKFGLRARDIARENNISLSTTLLPGMTLEINKQRAAD